MEFVKKCKRAWGRSSKRLYPEESGSGSYGKLSSKKSEPKKVAPQGYLAVYVGAERERFVIKIKHANHPLFKAFLDAAETEFGYSNDGPLCLPCHVDLFSQALAQIYDDAVSVSLGCGFPLGHRHNQSSGFHQTPLSS